MRSGWENWSWIWTPLFELNAINVQKSTALRFRWYGLRLCRTPHNSKSNLDSLLSKLSSLSGMEHRPISHTHIHTVKISPSNCPILSPWITVLLCVLCCESLTLSESSGVNQIILLQTQPMITSIRGESLCHYSPTHTCDKNSEVELSMVRVDIPLRLVLKSILRWIYHHSTKKKNTLTLKMC